MVQWLDQMGRVLGKPPPSPPPPSPPSFGKCPNIRKCTLFQIWACPKFQKSSFSRNKSPCGSFPHKVTFSEFTSRELIHFHSNLQNGGSPHFPDFGNVFPRLCQFWSKIKMVRMVYRNIFYRLDFNICDLKDELWRKTDILRNREIQNSVSRSRI